MDTSGSLGTGALVIHLKNDHLSLANWFFDGMTRVAVPRYQFQLPNTLLQTIEYLKDFEYHLKWPVAVYGTLIVYRAEPTEMAFRGHILDSLSETQFRLWKAEKQSEKREAITNLLAAKLQMNYSALNFGYCQELATQVIAFTLEEREVKRLAHFYLVAADQSREIFKGEVDMETKDSSGFGVRLAQSDVLRLRSNLAAFVRSDTPVQLIIE